MHSLADCVALAGRDHHHAGGDPDADLQPPDVANLKSGQDVDDVQPGANGPFRLPFMGKRVAEEGDDPVSQRREHIAVVAIDAGRAGVLVGADDDLKRLGIEPVRELGEADHVAEQHGATGASRRRERRRTRAETRAFRAAALRR